MIVFCYVIYVIIGIASGIGFGILAPKLLSCISWVKSALENHILIDSDTWIVISAIVAVIIVFYSILNVHENIDDLTIKQRNKKLIFVGIIIPLLSFLITSALIIISAIIHHFVVVAGIIIFGIICLITAVFFWIDD